MLRVKMYSERGRYVIIHIIKMSVHFLVFVVRGHYFKDFQLVSFQASMRSRFW